MVRFYICRGDTREELSRYLRISVCGLSARSVGSFWWSQGIHYRCNLSVSSLDELVAYVCHELATCMVRGPYVGYFVQREFVLISPPSWPLYMSGICIDFQGAMVVSLGCFYETDMSTPSTAHPISVRSCCHS